jgi:predicted RNA binding protein YcfA (HicA-like mRNA interferase family)
LPLRPTKVRKVVKTLDRLGFELVRTHGSHLIFKHDDGRMTVVPRHNNEEIGRGLLRKIAEDIRLSSDEFAKAIEHS